MLSVGFVAIDVDQKWMGGRYYLQHLIRCVAALPAAERVQMHDVWWQRMAVPDPFAEVRLPLGEPITVAAPTSLIDRLKRKLRRIRDRTPGSSDLFDAAGIDLFFPIPPCDNSGTTYVFWLPDFQYLRRPDLMSESLRAALETYFCDHVHAAAQIVLSSTEAQRDFAEVYPHLLHRTHVVRFCSVPDEMWWRLEPAQVADKYLLPERFLIVCNQFTRHKNHLTLFDALRILVARERSDIHLVCTGSTFDHRQEDFIGRANEFLHRHSLESRVHILGLIPRADQVALIRRSVAVMQPSWFEGWSTIIEDAKTLGKPVLASDLPVHHEQLGPLHAYYLSLDSAEEWADAIESVWSKCLAGPDTEAEAAGLVRLQAARRECGLAFVKALRAALPGNE
ncbi:MAG: glycosyltransferase family 4 protein [Lysobacterales bacterium]